MALLLAPVDDHHLAAKPSGRLLRVTRRGEPGKTIELTDGKCTIGSSSRCQVCLPAIDARPMQCLLALEADAITVTRWAAGVLLNGREFAAAPLGAGDVLSIGPWDMVLDLPQPAPPRSAEPPTAPPAPAETLLEPVSPPTPKFEPLPAASCPAAAEVRPERQSPVEFVPPPAVVEQLLLTGPSQLRQVEEALAELLAEASAPAPAPRAASKTLQMASRKTSPVTAPTPVRPRATASHAFADRLLLHLWTANHQARLRLAAVLDAARTARGEAASANASAATAVSDLVQAQAAHDADAANWSAELASLQAELALRGADHERLERELTACAERLAAAAQASERLAELTSAHADAQQSLAQLHTEMAERDRLLAQLSEERSGSDAAIAEMTDQLHREHQRTEQLQGEIERLVHEHAAALEAAHTEREKLREALAALEAAADLAPVPEYESAEESTPQLRSGQPLVEVDAELSDAWEHAVEPSESDEDAASEHLSGEASPEASDWLDRWRIEPAAAESQPCADSHDQGEAAHWPPEEIEPSEPHAAPEADRAEMWGSAPAADDEDSASYADLHQATRFDALEAPLEETLEDPVDESTAAPSRSEGGDLTTGLPIEASEPSYSSASFIDRYRGLLEDDGQDESPRGTSPARALLDEEFLSPAQARTGDDPEDDSDEALEAYMSNLMRRVRGDSAPGASVGMAARSTSLAAGLVEAPTPAPELLEPTQPEELLDLEALKARRRESARPLDLSALREIANDSFRIAMAEHKERRHVESVMNRSILFATAASASAYALYEAPSVSSLWFWAGAASAFAAGGLGIQLLLLLRRRLALQGRRLDPLAAIVTPVDFSPLQGLIAPAADQS